MMTKTEFLTHLEKRLQILKQNEREDILGEYAQHIELKMENGLSEEDAIRDFGDLDELADEILDAYNVDPGFGKEDKHANFAAVEKIGRKAGEVGRKTGTGLALLGRSIWGFVKKIVSACQRGIIKLLHWRPGKKEETSAEGITRLEDGADNRKRWRIKELFHREHTDDKEERRDTDMGTWISTLGRKIGRLAGRLLTICWKLCVLAFMAPIACFAAMALIGLGGLLVMVAQGYPLIGMTIMTFGSLACAVSFVWFIWDLFFGKSRRKGEEQTWESEEN